MSYAQLALINGYYECLDHAHNINTLNSCWFCDEKLMLSCSGVATPGPSGPGPRYQLSNSKICIRNFELLLLKKLCNTCQRICILNQLWQDNEHFLTASVHLTLVTHRNCQKERNHQYQQVYYCWVMPGIHE